MRMETTRNTAVGLHIDFIISSPPNNPRRGIIPLCGGAKGTNL